MTRVLSLVASKYSSPNLLAVTIFWPGLLIDLPNARALSGRRAGFGPHSAGLAENSALRCSAPEDLTFSH